MSNAKDGKFCFSDHFLELLKPRRDGNRLYYQANQDHPLYKEVHNLVLKGSGQACEDARPPLRSQSAVDRVVAMLSTAGRPEVNEFNKVPFTLMGQPERPERKSAFWPKSPGLNMAGNDPRIWNYMEGHQGVAEANKI